MNQSHVFVTACPECGFHVHMEHEPHMQQLFLCPRCETLLIVVQVSPLHVDWAFEEPVEEKPSFNPYYPHWPTVWQG